MANKCWAFGRFVSCWWNDGVDNKPGYYSITVRKKYKDKYGNEVEEKVSFLPGDATQLATELKAAVDKILMHPREIVRKTTNEVNPPEPDAPIDNSDIPF